MLQNGPKAYFNTHSNIGHMLPTITPILKRLLPCYDIGGEEENERSNKDANLLGGSPSSLLLLR